MKIERKIWMASRNIRKIPPWKIIEILNAFMVAQESGAGWESNLKDILQSKGLKRDFEAYDKNPGGDRTYKAQLISFGLLYEKEKKLILTKAGKDLCNTKNALLILRTQLLNMQYPSVYSIGRNVDISQCVKVKPVLFLLELMLELDYLTKDEISVAVIYGHSVDNLHICKDKILAIRSGKSLIDIIENREDVLTVKTKEKQVNERLEDIRNIANTFENWMNSTKLTIKKTEEGIRKNAIDPTALDLIKQYINNRSKFIETDISKIKENPVSFMKRYGSWDGKKDTSRVAIMKQSSPEIVLLKSKFLEFFSKDVFSRNSAAIYKNDMISLGFEIKDINSVVKLLSPTSTSLFEDTYIELSNGGCASKGIKFEEATEKLLNRLEFKSKLTGQLKRPAGKSGSYADIVSTYNKIAILFDTKSTKKYNVPHQDQVKAIQTYIPNWTELKDTHKKTDADKLQSFCYVSNDFVSSSVSDHLLNIEKETGCKTNAIKAWDLFKYIEKNESATAIDFFAKLSQSGLVLLNE